MSKLEIRRSNRSQSYHINTDESTGLGGSSLSKEKDLTSHWDNAYNNSAEDKLGWYETDVRSTLKLVKKANLNKDARIIIVGAGSTTLIDKLLEDGYTNLIATDISKIALSNLKKRLAGRAKYVEFIVDNLVNPTLLNKVGHVDLWIDRAVLHFFVNKTNLQQYLELLNRSIGKSGYAIFAEYNIDGAEMCSGLPINRFNAKKLKNYLGNEYKLISRFDHFYTMPSGDIRPYVYALFQRVCA